MLALKHFLLSLIVLLLSTGSFAQEREPVVAISTNLAFDAATALNLALDFSISPKVTLKAEAIFPWWTWNNQANAFQVNHINLGVRHWFGERSYKGWYATLAAGLGRYDIQPKVVGWRGWETLVTIGGGYATPLSSSVILDVGLGLGMMHTSFDRYEAAYGIRSVTDVGKRYLYFGPTDIHFTIYYLFTRGRR